MKNKEISDLKTVDKYNLKYYINSMSTINVCNASNLNLVFSNVFSKYFFSFFFFYGDVGKFPA
jgi:hypothetical protein